MNIGDTVKVLSTGEIGIIINLGQGWSCEDGGYVLYSVKVGAGRGARIYSVRANKIARV